MLEQALRGATCMSILANDGRSTASFGARHRPPVRKRREVLPSRYTTIRDTIDACIACSPLQARKGGAPLADGEPPLPVGPLHGSFFR